MKVKIQHVSFNTPKASLRGKVTVLNAYRQRNTPNQYFKFLSEYEKEEQTKSKESRK